MTIDVGHPSLDLPAAMLYRHARIDTDAERSHRCRCGEWAGVTVPAHASHVAQQLAIAGLLRVEAPPVTAPPHGFISLTPPDCRPPITVTCKCGESTTVTSERDARGWWDEHQAIAAERHEEETRRP